MKKYCLYTVLMCWHVTAFSDIRFDNQHWHVDISDQPLNSVLQELAQNSSLHIEPRTGITDSISMQFTADTIHQVLQRLLKNYNFITRPGQKRLEVIILSAKTTGSTKIALATKPTVTNDFVELILQRQPNQPFITKGSINHRPVSLLIDTGASMVAVPASLARRLKLRFGNRQTMHTANGQTIAYETVLPALQIGDRLSLSQVPAVILPRMTAQNQVLLGMNVLQEFEIIQKNNKLIIRRQ